jgi:hypothetical protein
MKYLEQRVEELEKEILKLKARIISLECKQDYLYSPLPSANDTKDLKENIWCPPYPEIIGSWDDAPTNINWGFPNLDYKDSSDLPTYYPPANPKDVLEESTNEPTDDCGFKMNYDKMDKDFLEWLATEDKKPRRTFKWSRK